jgi:uncharacterized protein (TIGR03437 family)
MRFVPFLVAARLFAAASASPTAIDNAGNVWLTGSTSFILTTGSAFQKTATSQVCGEQDLSPFQGPTAIYCAHAYLIEYDPFGHVLYATYLAGSSQDGGTVLTTDAHGNVYVAGYTGSADFPVSPGAAQPENAGPIGAILYTALGAPFGIANVIPGGDVFIAKFTSSGTLVFSTFLGGSGSDIPRLIAVDSAGAVYVAGVTNSTNFPITSNAMTSQPAANFFAKLNPTGTSFTYSTYSPLTIDAFDVDNQGHAYLTGDNKGVPYVTVIDTSAGAVEFSQSLSGLKPSLIGAGAAIALTGSGDIMLAVSPTPTLFSLDSYPYQPVRTPGASYLFQLNANATQIVTETDVSHSLFDSILLDTAGNAYAFGNGTGAIPQTPIQPLPEPCSQSAATFVLETNPAGTVVTATYFRQGDDTAVSIAAPAHIQLYRTASSTVVTLDITAQPTALFGCPANLASGVANQGLAPGEIFMLTGTGLGPAQGIGAVPDANGVYPTTLGGVQVFFGTTPVPLLYAQANEIHAVAPFGFPAPAAIQVQYANQTVSPLDVPTEYVNPGIFSIGGQGAIINSDGTVNTPANPAKLGSYVSLYCTGTGYLEYPVTDGTVAPIPPPYITTQYTMQETFAGVAGVTLWSGAAPGLIEGVTQINVQLPASLPAGTNLGAVPVVLSAMATGSPAVNISVKQ